MKKFPLETPRLRLRPLRMADARALARIVRASLDSLRPYLPWADENYDLAAARHFIRFASEERERGSGLHLGIFDARDGELLGMIGFMRMGDATLGFEIGYWMRSDRQGEGLMSEAARRMIRHGFERLGARRVWLNCDVRNRASRRVAEKLGMRREGRVKAFLVDADGRERDHYLYGMLKREFEA